MTSLAGSSGEDFASILRSLGYRLDRRPKPPEPAAAAAPAADAESAQGGVVAEAALEASAEETQEPAADTPEEGTAPEPGADTPLALGIAPAVPDESQAAAEAETAVDTQTGAPPADSAEEPPAGSAEPAPLDAVAQGIAPMASDEPAEAALSEPVPEAAPELVEVWRPGRYEGRGAQSQRSGPGRHRPSQKPQGNQPARQDETAPQIAADSPPPASRRNAFRPDRSSTRPDAGNTDRSTQKRDGFRAKDGQKPRRDRPDNRREERFGDRNARPGRDQRPAHVQSAPPERREKTPDPNSPFAKLLALKEQLEANTKPRP